MPSPSQSDNEIQQRAEALNQAVRFHLDRPTEPQAVVDTAALYYEFLSGISTDADGEPQVFVKGDGHYIKWRGTNYAPVADNLPRAEG